MVRANTSSGNELPNELPGLSFAPNAYIILANSKGFFGIFNQMADEVPQYQIDEQAVMVRAGFATCFYSHGFWADVPDQPHREIVVGLTHDGDRDGDYFTYIRAYAAELAARMAGLTDRIKLLDRHEEDERFHCPHCGKKYAVARCFGSHLLCDHKDRGADWYVDGYDFWSRNGASVKGWRKIKTESATT